MTLSTQSNSVQYTAVGNTGETFTISFPFFSNSEIMLLEAGVLQAQGTIYTVTGAGEPGGGTATYVGAPAASATIDIIRVIALTQNTDLRETGKFSAEAVEDALDKQVMIGQQSLTLDSTTGLTFDAKGGGANNRRIVNVADPTGDQDVATKAFVASQVSGAGNVPAPLIGDVGEHLEATGAGTFDWRITEEVPTPVAADIGQVLEATSAAVNGFAFNTVPAAGGRAANLLVNGDFRIAQQGTSFTAATTPANNDDTILLDRWRLLSNGNDIVDVTQETGAIPLVPDTATSAIKLLVATANFKFGIIQVIESSEVARAFDNATGKVSLSFEARTTTGAVINNIRAGILSWTGTADQPTTDVVTSWAAAGTDPTLATSWAFENTPANITVTADAYATHKVEDVSLDTSGTNNIAVFIWSDDTTTTAGDVLYIGNVQLVIGDRVDQYGHRALGDELRLSQRYMQVFDVDTTADLFATGYSESTTDRRVVMPLIMPMHKVPTLAISAAGDFTWRHTGATTAATGLVITQATPEIVGLTVTTAAAGTAGQGGLLEATNTSAKMTFTADLEP